MAPDISGAGRAVKDRSHAPCATANRPRRGDVPGSRLGKIPLATRQGQNYGVSAELVRCAGRSRQPVHAGACSP